MLKSSVGGKEGCAYLLGITPSTSFPRAVPRARSGAGRDGISSSGPEGAAGSSLVAGGALPAPRGRAEPKNKQIEFDPSGIN